MIVSGVGRLVADPNLKTVNSKTVCEFTVAARVDRDTSDFYRVSVWGASGENCSKYLKKRSLVFVSGPLKHRLYDGRDGEKHLSLEVSANTVEFVPSGKPEEANSATAGTSNDDVDNMFN